MKDTIKEELQQFEEEYGITIISARDTGSRAWNLESEDSDYDVSFIYIQDHADYITPSGYKQNIDRESKTDYDIEYNSWNLDRFLALLKNSNPSAIEMLQSQEVYYEPYNKYMWDLEEEARNNFKPLALMMHHHNLAKNQYKRYLENRKKMTVKRHLYAIRSLMYREYVRKNKELPSIDFTEFLEKNGNVLDGWASHNRVIRRMANQKKNGYGKKQVSDTTITKKIGIELDDQIPDDKKPDYVQQNIDRDYLNNRTEQLIKEVNKNPCTWKKAIQSTFKALTKT